MVRGGHRFHRRAAASGSVSNRLRGQGAVPVVRDGAGRGGATGYDRGRAAARAHTRTGGARAAAAVAPAGPGDSGRTVGLGGHARALIPQVLPGGRYIGLDLDESLLAEARGRLETLAPGCVELRHANFAEFPAVLA